MTVEIYTKDNCMFCKKAKELMKENDVAYKEIDAGTVAAFKKMQDRLPGVSTVPQIIIDGHHIGGFDVLEAHQNAIFKKYHSNKKLEEPVKFKGSNTEKNILKAFVGECVARMRYTFFASKAKKEGYVQISHVFEETADQEKAHASRLYKFLEGREVKITETFPAGGNGTTEENLRDAAGGEQHEHEHMYPEFARIARDEGFSEIADVFENIAIAEQQHGKRFLELAENIKNEQVFVRKESHKWRCRNCGFVHEGEEAVDKCPACAHSKAYFELLGENW
ncbi:Rubrerythrin (modular protein) [Candidatus Terasakiella magnetica]|uniref:Rubrerythrin n=1 Tax=Candidatus Terasakiella magnetica TaxID=1867952 RepID=A0A1C3RIL0_9PROT|nr:ferritin family protein [Candidatus Terasakiella magnetica]SCA57108.1 Rubrerythrin (modular protein) [Candidatus Terasakiella magnetica]